ncbi:MAG: NAD(P)-dependent oxidoreductase [Desulfovibrio sp.]|jgi:UDP-glucose 4-epimerase|nr:NAD(P)-dependent oxidoreductase [Desulfovibrio sp.]
MKITVFGGAGFLGSHVCDKLSDAGHDVTVFDLRPSPWIRPDQVMISGDILDEAAVDAATAGADAVYNFAGISDIGEAGDRPLDTARLNILGAIILLEAARKAKVKRFVFASSLYVYSKAGGFYRCSKQACELYIENYRQVYDLPYTILRYGSLYGPRADRRNAIYRFVREALETGRIEYFGLPTALREYIHVEDAALCSVEILDPEYADSNIVLTGSQPMRVEDLLKMIAEMLGKEIDFAFLGDGKTGHYEITPYSFSPHIGKKMVPRLSTDLGQGILRVIEDVHREVNPTLTSALGYLVEKEKARS